MGPVDVLPLAAVAVAVVVIGVGLRAFTHGGRQDARLGQAVLVGFLAAALYVLLVWAWDPEMGGLGFFLILAGVITVLLSLRIDPHDRTQLLLNMACIDLALSVAWAIWIARGDSDVTGGSAMLVGILFAQIVTVPGVCTALLLRSYLARVEGRAPNA